MMKTNNAMMRSRWIFSFSLWLLIAGNLLVQGQEPVELTQRWEMQPPLDAFRRERTPVEYPLDMRRLTSAHEEYQLAEARALIATKFPVVEDKRARVVTVALENLKTKQSARDLRLAMASLILKYAESGGAEFAELWALAVDDPVLRSAVERGLAERQHLAPKELWLERLASPYAPATVDVNTAVRGLKPVATSEARGVLISVLHDDRLDYSTRLAAARSLSGNTNGLEEHSQRLLAGKLPARELLAVELLSQHDSAATERLMQTILDSDSKPAQVISFRWLRKHRPDVAVELAQDLIQHTDSSMRLEVALALNQHSAPESLRLQGSLLSDRNATVRRTIRDHLIEKWQVEEYQPIVNELLDFHLKDSGSFEGQEQAILVLVAIEARERVGRLLELLDHPRQEVAVRAAWGLQQLAREPGELATIFEYCQRWTDRLDKGDRELPVVDTDVFRMAYLFQALGHNRYSQADAMLRRYVPKQRQKMRANTRAAAIWALGEIWAGSLDSGLEDALMERLMDMDPIDPEELQVQYASAIALGRFANPRSLPGLENAPYSNDSPLGIAVAWSIEQIEAAEINDAQNQN